jgi:hypothetical protein
MRDNTPAHLKNVLAASPQTAPPEDECELPSSADGEYQPYARAANRPLYSIHFVTSKREVRSFQYIQLDSNSSFTSDGIALRFTGMRAISVRIAGRNLWRLYDLIHAHKMSWVMEVAPGRDFVKDGDAVVTSVRIIEVKDDPSAD